MNNPWGVKLHATDKDFRANLLQLGDAHAAGRKTPRMEIVFIPPYHPIEAAYVIPFDDEVTFVEDDESKGPLLTTRCQWNEIVSVELKIALGRY